MAQTLSNVFSHEPETDRKVQEWLQLLLGDWQVVSDLLGADLVLWVPRDDTLLAVAHTRPGSGMTVYYEDPVGTAYTREEWPEIFDALTEARLGEAPIGQGCMAERESRPAFVQFAPVIFRESLIALVSVESFDSPVQERFSEVEREQRRIGLSLLRMMSEGAFPIEGAPIPPRRGAPRASDGWVSVDEQGCVLVSSPNALSAFHRFGVHEDMAGRSLAEIATADLQSRIPVDESLPLVLTGRAAWRADMQAHGGILSLRAIPLTRGGVREGAIILVRDVTEVRRREQELMTKDATIREVHHRVKNNLQTVAALLRLQSRRMKSDEAREALLEAMRRVSTIALVHESLLQGSEETVHFDEVIERCLRLAIDAASASVRGGESQAQGVRGLEQVVVNTERHGRVGVVRAEEATPLALVVAELATNAVEHGLAQTGGTLSVTSERTGSHLVIHIDDDGVGMGNPPEGLGTNIAQTLVQGELGGVLSWENRADGGTRATVDVYLDPVSHLRD